MLLFLEKYTGATMTQTQKQELLYAFKIIETLNRIAAYHNAYTALLESHAGLFKVGRIDIQQYDSGYRDFYSKRAELRVDYDQLLTGLKETVSLETLFTLERNGRGLGSLKPLEND